MTATHILTDVTKVDQVAAELAELIAAGVNIAVTALELVALEAKGFVVDLETGKPVEPVFALDRKGGAL